MPHYYSLTKSYKHHKQCLTQTGGGLRVELGGDGIQKELEFYIPGDGLSEETPTGAKNLWGEFAVITSRICCQLTLQ